MLGVAGIMVAIAVISANYAATAPPVGQPAVHASASPTAVPAHP
jgi:hypothetical protein